MAAAPTASQARVLALIEHAADRVSPKTVTIAREMVAANEFEDALGLLGDMLASPGVTVPLAVTAQFRAVAADLGLPADVADQFRAPPPLAPVHAPLLVNGPASPSSPESQRLSLYISIPTIATRSLFPAAALLVLYAIRGDTVILYAVAAVVGLVAVPFWLNLAARRIDLDDESLTTVPMLRLIRAPRRYPFSTLGEFAPKKQRWASRGPVWDVLRAPVNDPSHPVPWQEYLDFTAYFARSPGSPALSAYQLKELLNGYIHPDGSDGGDSAP